MTHTRFPLLGIFAISAGILLWGAPARSADKASDKIALKVIKVDSEETAGEDGKGANAVDGDPDTFWHTQWQDASPGCPHEIIIQLDPPSQIKGLTYLPRQGDTENGNIKEYEIYLSDDGKDFGKPVKAGEFEKGKEKKVVGFDLKQAGFIKLVAKSEINGNAWTSIAELGVLRETDKIAIAPSLKVVKVDSEETTAEDNKGTNAIDGKSETFWHTQWENGPACPHEIIIQLTPAMKIKGFTYLPRQDDSDHGNIKEYEFYISADGKDFGKPVTKGTFENNKDKKTVSMEPATAAFVKLKALSEVNGEAWTSAAEIKVIPAE